MRHPVSVARDFSKTPGPRYIRQGKWSGEKFRELLVQRIKKFGAVVVDLDGTRGYGSSFLDEAFGGLIREGYMTKNEFPLKVAIVSDEDPSYKIEALEAVQKAQLRH
ncbi:STAS-like domain-containing protein [Brevundimonas sanguinis]|uniref:STAS-like domain-containing protein n=1 Tax=Brevundimonas sanguinis TaxID=3021811 RepID=UPI002415937D|nr:STAS-like domain-containing protein [Brevundimonas sp. NCCP 15609]